MGIECGAKFENRGTLWMITETDELRLEFCCNKICLWFSVDN